MRKLGLMLVAIVFFISLSIQTQVQAAAKPISIYIDGEKLYPSQAPILVKGSTMLPLRAIFEALDAEVLWNQKTKTVTATRDNTTVILKIGAKTATVNNKIVSLQVPAQVLKGSTMVPVRFVSEALGETVKWNQVTQTVNIITVAASTPVTPVSYVTARVTGKNGDGRDVEISFQKSQQESAVKEYRVLMVKSANSNSFNLSHALSTGNYTSIPPSGEDASITLSSQTMDVNGELLRSNQSYVAYILMVGKSGVNVLSGASSTITLTVTSSVGSVTSVTASDVSDYGDGRDLSVNFVRPQNDTNTSSYRIMVVKTKDISNFNLSAANALSSSNYTLVNKGTSTSVITVLSSSSRDTSGELIKNGVPYTIYVLAVSNNSTISSQLSLGSSSITLNTNAATTPVITRVDDVSNYGDGRDLLVNFNKITNESSIGSYRIFVVKASNANNFTLSSANAVSSSYYTSVSKTGYNISQVLSSGARDVDGSLIANGISYRVFVMAVSNNSSSNTLSAASSTVVLSGNGKVTAATNVSVNDVADNNDGRDLQVSFTRASDESNLNQYRIMVVKASNASYFTLSTANAVSSYNYTSVYRTGYNINQVLSSSARDVDGDLIRNGTSYRVFILSVANGNTSDNVLSSYSSSITLSNNSTVGKATNVQVSDVSDKGNGSDLRVSFTRASDETNINHYRIFVVKSGNADYFTLSNANSTSYYTTVTKSGISSYINLLPYDARDVNGELIRNDVSYKVFVLSVSNSSSSNNVLSTYSSAIVLSNNTTTEVVTGVKAEDIADNGNGSDLKVSFNKPSNETIIKEYRILVSLPSVKLDEKAASKIENYTFVAKGSSSKVLPETATDIYGSPIKNGNYNVYVLSVGTNESNALSTGSLVTLANNSKVNAVTNIAAKDVADSHNAGDIEVSFKVPSDEKNIIGYRIFVVKYTSVPNFDLAKASSSQSGRFYPVGKGDFNSTLDPTLLDSDGEKIIEKFDYYIKVLSVSNEASGNNLSAGAYLINLEDKSVTTPVEMVTNVIAMLNTDGDKPSVNVSFSANDNSVTMWSLYFQARMLY
ncbi:copper amine oxidase N-terminal domain-containing protein [Paenibacillus pini]|uniref:Copper amine oxidase domain protein n=1 Tax=Paenibacillus pini JCM 16418 TaxID=1236976 RepID=W7YMV5_9BACL|nr:copper amine oxidase N-terminal domain-containing protein [Paenibacillus pini]GAF09787.1 copper amine oxidase domain protein [Paenibacillus pini JCM 16418]